MLYLPILKGAPSIDFAMYTCPTFIKGLQSCLQGLSTMKTVKNVVYFFLTIFQSLKFNMVIFLKYSTESNLAAVFIQETHFKFRPT